MPKWLRPVVLTTALVAVAPAARAVPVTLQLDPERSVAIQGPVVESLAGSITLRLGALPLAGAATSFDVIGLAIVTSGGAAIGLDPTIASPGLGVLSPDGTFLIPTLFVHVADGSNFAIPDLTGTVFFGPGGASLTRLLAGLVIDDGRPAGPIEVQIDALPEPAAGTLLALGALALGTRSRRPRTRR